MMQQIGISNVVISMTNSMDSINKYKQQEYTYQVGPPVHVRYYSDVHCYES